MTHISSVAYRVGLALAFSLGTAATAQAQTSTCLPVDGYAANFRLSAQLLIRATDSVDVARRTRLQVPVIDTSKVAYVSDSKVCAALVNAINSYMRSTNLVARVYVLDLGNVYLVQDPNARAGEWTPNFSVTHKYGVLGLYSN